MNDATLRGFLPNMLLLAVVTFLVLSSKSDNFPILIIGPTTPSYNAFAGGSRGDVGQREGRLLANIRQVTFGGKRAGEGYFSQDQSLMVFQSEREPGNPFFQIYLMDLNEGETRRVSPGYGKTTCGWIHPDKEKILFASTHQDPDASRKQEIELAKRASGKARRYSWDYDEQFDIFERRLDGRHLKNLTNTLGYDAEGSWSPDGKLIVFSSNRHAYTEKLSTQDQAIFDRDKSYLVDIYLMNTDGTGVRRLTETKGYDGGPFFSADGKKIVWRRFSVDGLRAEVFTMNVDGTEQKQITHLGIMSWAPYFHPSGDYLVFSANREGFRNIELYLVDAKGKSEPVRVTYMTGFDGLPVFFPDGKRLSWTSNRTANKRSQIFMADWKDSEARMLLGLNGRSKISPRSGLVSDPSMPDLSQTVPEISADDLRLHVSYLASKAMGGRLTGTEGERLATTYVASVFQFLGLEPAGDNGTLFQEFEFAARVSLGRGNQLTLRGADSKEKVDYLVDEQWRPLAFSKTGLFGPARVVFAGYGIVAPAREGHEAYDSYFHLNVRDKWVLVFRYLPEGLSPKLRQHLARYAGLRYKAMVTRDRGARGLIVVSGPNSKVKDELVRFSFDSSVTGTSIPAISVKDDLAEQLLQASGKSLKELQDTLDTGEPMEGFQVPHVTLEVSVNIRQEKRTGRNVLGRLNAGKSYGKTMVIVGAHVDHLGGGLGTGSLARGEEMGKVHYGANDNASGVAGVLEIAQYLVALRAKGDLPMQRDVLFAAWSGEELGLLGSNHFAKSFAGERSEPSVLTPGIAAYLNMDMIGRLREALVVQGVGSSTIWTHEIERHSGPTGLAITTQDDSYLPTDATTFYLKGVPILSAFTGAHEEYHTPQDTPDKINYEGTEKVAHFMALMTRSLATRSAVPDYIQMKRPAGSVGRRRLRVYLGTIPDYAHGEVLGVKLSGVAKGGPADLAGVKGGDIIVELAGKKIENIYDYTYTADALKVGVPVKTVVLREDQRVELTITPESRD